MVRSVRTRRDARALSNTLVALMKEHYGKGPTAAKSFINDEYVLTVLEDGLTRNEETLLEAGEELLVRDYRLRFQRAVEAEFCSAPSSASPAAGCSPTTRRSSSTRRGRSRSSCWTARSDRPRRRDLRRRASRVAELTDVRALGGLVLLAGARALRPRGAAGRRRGRTAGAAGDRPRAVRRRPIRWATRSARGRRCSSARVACAAASLIARLTPARSPRRGSRARCRSACTARRGAGRSCRSVGHWRRSSSVSWR